MVINNFDVFRAIGPTWPFKADSPLLVDADAVLALPVAEKSLQVITRKLCELPQVHCRFQNSEPFFSLMSKAFPGRNPFAFGEALDFSVSIAPNHKGQYRVEVRGTSNIIS